MFYKIRNILSVSALALIAAANNNLLYAQGVVTLSEEAMFDEGTTNSSSSVPSNAPLFGNSDNVSAPEKKSDPLQKPAPAKTVEDSVPTAGAEVSKQPAPVDEVVTVEAESDLFGANDIPEIDDAVFDKMSDLEKQTALLNLELRREKVKNEIEAIKNQRKQALIQEQEKAAEKERLKVEWEKEQERKVLQEQQRLRELDIQFEKERQERLLNAYKNDMLAKNQEWIAHDASLYKKIEGLKDENSKLLDDMRNKLKNIQDNVAAASVKSTEAIEAYQKEIDNLQTKISVLNARIEAQEREMEKKNPFAEGEQGAEASQSIEEVAIPELKLANMYAVMEIRGQGGELIAKLINQDGTPFYVKKGTSLQSGHVIDEITSTYVRAEKEGLKDYLYFAAGGILPLEQPRSNIKPALPEATATKEQSRPAFATSIGVPGLGTSMIAR